MRHIIGWTTVFILIFTTVYFYNSFKINKLNKLQFWGAIAVYLAYRFFTAGMLSWMIRVPISFLFLAILLFVINKEKSLISLFISHLLVTILDLVAVLLMGLTVGILGLNSENFGSIMLFYILIIFGILNFKIYKNQKLLEKGGELLESTAVRLMIFTAVFLLIIAISLLFSSGTLDIASELIPSIVIMGSAMMFIATVIILMIMTARHLFLERKKQQELEAENEQLRLEKVVIEEKMTELMESLNSVQLSFSQLESNHHAYKYTIPILMGMQNKLMEELAFFAENTHDEKLAIIEDYANQIRVLGKEVNADFVDDYIKTEVAGLNIPSDWVELAVLLERLMQTAKKQGVLLSVFNYVQTWDKSVSSNAFIRLLSNLADNAIKESTKIDEDIRGSVQIILKNDEDVLTFEVRDSASEFAIDILKNLGIRKNSTNGTGDGFSEVMDTIEQTEASLLIEEWKNNDRNGKSVSVAFDGYGMKLISSHYRTELLASELKNDFEVMY